MSPQEREQFEMERDFQFIEDRLDYLRDMSQNHKTMHDSEIQAINLVSKKITERIKKQREYLEAPYLKAS
nr:hypothetical protein [Cytophagales bacterium]